MDFDLTERERFYRDRSKQLQDLVHSAMGKRTMLRDLPEGVVTARLTGDVALDEVGNVLA